MNWQNASSWLLNLQSSQFIESRSGDEARNLSRNLDMPYRGKPRTLDFLQDFRFSYERSQVIRVCMLIVMWYTI